MILTIRKDTIITFVAAFFLLLNAIVSITSLVLYRYFPSLHNPFENPFFAGLVIRFSFAATAGIIFISAFAAIRRWKQNTLIQYHFERMLFLMFLLAGMSFFVGMLMKNAIHYVVGDVIRILLVPLVYFCSLLFYYEKGGGILIKNIYYIYLTAALFDILIQITDFIVLKQIFVLTMGAFHFPLLYLSLIKNKKKIHWIIMILLIVSGAFSFKRGNWAVLILIPITLMITEIQWRSRWKIIKTFVLLYVSGMLIVAIVGIALYGSLNAQIDIFKARFGLAWNAISIVKARSADKETNLHEGRAGELLAILRQMRGESSVLSWMIGFGAGAEYNSALTVARLNPDALSQNDTYIYGSKKNYVHSVHSTWLAFLFKTGIIGVLFFLFFIIAILSILWRILYKRIMLTETQRMHMQAILSYFLFYLLIGPIGNVTFLGDLNFAIFLIVAGWLIRDINSVHQDQKNL
ncbi:MAG: hypothetical protein HYW78_03510 [Parcubacteria group bacterium]|nr:hypothetical protein [Parcubacteria group bacterium]